MLKRSRTLGGPLAGHVPRFRARLLELGYSNSAVTRHVRLAAQLSEWMDREFLSVGELTAASAEEFFRSGQGELADGALACPAAEVPVRGRRAAAAGACRPGGAIHRWLPRATRP